MAAGEETGIIEAGIEAMTRRFPTKMRKIMSLVRLIMPMKAAPDSRKSSSAGIMKKEEGSTEEEASTEDAEERGEGARLRTEIWTDSCATIGLQQRAAREPQTVHEFVT